MDWMRKRVWQLGIGVVLALLGAWIIYAAGTDGASQGLLWLGLILFFIAMAVPLASRAWQSAQEREGEGGES